MPTRDLVLDIATKLVDSSAVGGFGINSKQIITFWNDEAQKLTNYAGSEVIGKPCWEVLAGTDEEGRRLCRRGCRIMLGAEFDGYVRPFNMRISIDDVRELWVNVVSLVIPSALAEGASVFHLLQDIDWLKEAQQLAQQVMDATARFQTLRELPPRLARRGAAGEAALSGELDAAASKGTSVAKFRAQPDESISEAGVTCLKSLTPKEKEVLKLLRDGCDTYAIAEKLVISHATARNHVQHVLTKMGVHSRLEAICILLGQQH